MIDPQLLRESPDVLKQSQRARGDSVEVVDVALEADIARRSAIAAFEDLRAEQNAFGKTVAKAPKDEKKELVAQAQVLAGRVKEASAASTLADEAFDVAIRAIANPVIEGVPAGGEENFVTLRTHGTPTTFDFEPLDHADLGEKLGAIDIKRGTKVSGSRFYFLRGIGARLELALMNMALDKALAAFTERGYHATSITDLTEAMGLTAGSVYKAFKDKRGVFLAAFDRYRLLGRARLLAGIARAETGRDKIRQMLMYYVDLSYGEAGRNGCLVVSGANDLALLDEEAADRVAAAFALDQAMIADLIRIGQSDGTITTGIDADAVALTLLCLTKGVRIIGKTGRTREEMTAVADTAMTLLR